MSRSIRVSLLFVLALAFMATGALANIPTAELSTVPESLTLSPGPRYVAEGNPVGDFLVHVEGPVGPVNGSVVTVEIAPDAEALISWCIGQSHPFYTGMTDVAGDAHFDFFGGGCLDPGGAFIFTTFIVQVKADGVLLGEPAVSSPDAVNSNGRVSTDTEATNCEDPGTGSQTTVGLSDAVFHTRPIKLGLIEQCTQLAPPYSGAVDLGDAVAVTPYIKNSNFCLCQ